MASTRIARQTHRSQFKNGTAAREPSSTRTAQDVKLPADQNEATLSVGKKTVTLTNLTKVFWPEDHITKGDLLQYYADVSSYLLPHIRSRAMVMKRYPEGAHGEFFFQKRAPKSRPEWIPVCEVQHPSANL